MHDLVGGASRDDILLLGHPRKALRTIIVFETRSSQTRFSQLNLLQGNISRVQEVQRNVVVVWSKSAYGRNIDRCVVDLLLALATSEPDDCAFRNASPTARISTVRALAGHVDTRATVSVFDMQVTETSAKALNKFQVVEVSTQSRWVLLFDCSEKKTDVQEPTANRIQETCQGQAKELRNKTLDTLIW